MSRLLEPRTSHVDAQVLTCACQSIGMCRRNLSKSEPSTRKMYGREAPRQVIRRDQSLGVVFDHQTMDSPSLRRHGSLYISGPLRPGERRRKGIAAHQHPDDFSALLILLFVNSP